MKVILLSGSPKSEGNTMQVLESCRKVIENEGLEAKVLSLSGKKIEGCIACNYCKSHNGCSLQDDFQTIVEEIRDADGFIIGSPVYFGTARGEVMSFLQRLGMVSKSNGLFLENMVGGPIVVARRGGHTATIQELLMFFFINGMTVPGANYWNMLFGGAPGSAMEDEEGLITAKKFAYNVARLIKLENK